MSRGQLITECKRCVALDTIEAVPQGIWQNNVPAVTMVERRIVQKSATSVDNFGLVGSHAEASDGREEEATGAYREALAQDPSMHDAHFNLSRLHEKAQRPRKALHHARGHALEESHVMSARAAYLAALHAYSDHLESRINLGRLLHMADELKEAEQVYRQAKSSSALLSFNSRILLEDLGDICWRIAGISQNSAVSTPLTPSE